MLHNLTSKKLSIKKSVIQSKLYLKQSNYLTIHYNYQKLYAQQFQCPCNVLAF